MDCGEYIPVEKCALEHIQDNKIEDEIVVTNTMIIDRIYFFMAYFLIKITITINAIIAA